MKMNPVELNAYRMIFRNGTVKQVRQALWDIAEVEPTVTEELLSDIIAMLRHRGMHVVWELAWPIHKLLGKTHSMGLYQVAEELGYLELDRFQFKVCASGKVNLFVKEQFYHPEVEPLVIDELYQWLNYIEQDIRQQYSDDMVQYMLDPPEFDNKLKKTEYFTAPLMPVARILTTLSKIGSAQGRQALLALEYLFRPRVNDYFMIEQKRASEGNERAVKQPGCLEEENPWALLMEFLETPNIYHFRRIVDSIARIARSGPAIASDRFSA